MPYLLTYPSIFLLALAIDVVFGDPQGHLHPVALQGRLIGFLWQQRKASTPGGLFVWGLFIVLAGLVATVLPVGLFQWTFHRQFSSAGEAGGLNPYVFLPLCLFGALLLKGTFSLRMLLSVGRKVADALNTSNLEEARHLVGYHLVSRPTDKLDNQQVSSAAIESLAENFTDSFASPTAYFALGGFSAAWAYRFLNTADAMLGYREGDREMGGKAAARIDDVLNWLPARAAGLVMTLAAINRDCDCSAAWRVMRRDAMRCPSPNSGWTMACAAGALGVRLEKKDVYVLNPDGRLPDGNDLKKLEKLLIRSAAIWTILLTGILLLLRFYIC